MDFLPKRCLRCIWSASTIKLYGLKYQWIFLELCHNDYIITAAYLLFQIKFSRAKLSAPRKVKEERNVRTRKSHQDSRCMVDGGCHVMSCHAMQTNMQNKDEENLN